MIALTDKVIVALVYYRSGKIRSMYCSASTAVIFARRYSAVLVCWIPDIVIGDFIDSHLYEA